MRQRKTDPTAWLQKLFCSAAKGFVCSVVSVKLTAAQNGGDDARTPCSFPFTTPHHSVDSQRERKALCPLQKGHIQSVQSVQLLSCVRLFATPWTAAHQASLSITNSWSLLKLMSIESMMPSNHLILCRLLLVAPSLFPSIRVFSNESVLRVRWPKYWSFSFNISPSNEYSGLISFRMDWLDLLAVQGTLKSLLQHHSSKASILWCSAFFIVQLLRSYMTTGKTSRRSGV